MPVVPNVLVELSRSGSRSPLLANLKMLVFRVIGVGHCSVTGRPDNDDSKEHFAKLALQIRNAVGPLMIPVFDGSFADVKKELQRQEDGRTVLVIYLHSRLHPKADEIVRRTLCNPQAKAALDSPMLLWMADVGENPVYYSLAQTLGYGQAFPGFLFLGEVKGKLKALKALSGTPCPAARPNNSFRGCMLKDAGGFDPPSLISPRGVRCDQDGCTCDSEGEPESPGRSRCGIQPIARGRPGEDGAKEATAGDFDRKLARTHSPRGPGTRPAFDQPLLDDPSRARGRVQVLCCAFGAVPGWAASEPALCPH